MDNFLMRSFEKDEKKRERLKELRRAKHFIDKQCGSEEDRKFFEDSFALESGIEGGYSYFDVK